MNKLPMEVPGRNGPSISWDAVTVSELRLGDSDLPQQTAARTSLIMQISAPVVVELGLDGCYQRRLMGPGNFCVTPAGEPVAAVRWQGERQIVLAEFSPVLIQSVAESHHLRSFELVARKAVSDPLITHPVLALREELLSANPSGEAYVDMIARAIVLRLLRAHSASAAEALHRGGLPRSSLRRVIEYINANLDQDLGLRSMAAVSGLSEDHFARAFRESTGVPPHRYLLQQRLERARQMLETSDMSIVEIAQALGFADQSHLTNLFRRNLGMTPGRVRAQLGRKPEGRRNFPKDAGILQETSRRLQLFSS
jgi:AraC family transcriptional regulator